MTYHDFKWFLCKYIWAQFWYKNCSRVSVTKKKCYVDRTKCKGHLIACGNISTKPINLKCHERQDLLSRVFGFRLSFVSTRICDTHIQLACCQLQQTTGCRLCYWIICDQRHVTIRETTMRDSFSVVESCALLLYRYYR